MSRLTVFSRYDSQQKGWDALFEDGGQKWKIVVTTAFLYRLAP